MPNFEDFNAYDQPPLEPGSGRPALLRSLVQQAAGGFESYQIAAAATAVYPGAGEHQVIYPVLGLLSEAGEVARVVSRCLDAGPDNAADPATRLARELMTLADEVGLVFDVMKKAYRNDDGNLSADAVRSLKGLQDHISSTMTAIRVAANSGRISLPPLDLGPQHREMLLMELGDAQYYVAAAVTEARALLGAVALAVTDKLFDRAARGVLRSTGDQR